MFENSTHRLFVDHPNAYIDRDTLPQQLKFIEKFFCKNNSLLRIDYPVRLVTFRSQVLIPLPLRLKENGNLLVPVFIAGVGFEPATFGL